jgi:hypothetical protein
MKLVSDARTPIASYCCYPASVTLSNKSLWITISEYEQHLRKIGLRIITLTIESTNGNKGGGATAGINFFQRRTGLMADHESDDGSN